MSAEGSVHLKAGYLVLKLVDKSVKQRVQKMVEQLVLQKADLLVDQ